MSAPVLQVEGLSIAVRREGRRLVLTHPTNFALRAAQTTAIVGESGCGKSITALALLNLLRPPLSIAAGRILLRGDNEVQDIAALDPGSPAMRDVRGRQIAMVFQDPMTALDPVYPVGDQIAEGLRRHLNMPRAAAIERAVTLLRQVGIAAPEKRVADYPHQLSGGMRQRVMIAMAIACAPRVLVADEPTTALDVTVQAQILDLLRELQASLGMACLFITHDLGVVAEIADDVIVMYRGTIVERAPVADLLGGPRHPYTQGLLASLPPIDGSRRSLRPIPGQVRPPDEIATGCPFVDRCDRALAVCASIPPPVVALSASHSAACHALAMAG
jgi:peptide/nickel transport system ATP-binding protein